MARLGCVGSKCGGYDGKYIDGYIRVTMKDIAV